MLHTYFVPMSSFLRVQHSKLAKCSDKGNCLPWLAVIRLNWNLITVFLKASFIPLNIYENLLLINRFLSFDLNLFRHYFGKHFFKDNWNCSNFWLDLYRQRNGPLMLSWIYLSTLKSQVSFLFLLGISATLY